MAYTRYSIYAVARKNEKKWKNGICQQPFDRFWRSIGPTSYDMLPRKDSIFGDPANTAPYLGVESQPSILRAWIGFFKPNAQNIQTSILSKPMQRCKPNLHNDKHLQRLFASGLKICPTTPRGRTAAIFNKVKNRYIQQSFDRFWRSVSHIMTCSCTRTCFLRVLLILLLI